MPTTQVVPFSGHGSSTPSRQSSSRPLQVSVVEPVRSVHIAPPAPSHAIIPSRQASESPPSHELPTLNPSSVSALQLSSIPLQISVLVPVTSLQTVPVPAPLHTVTPSLHRSPSPP